MKLWLIIEYKCLMKPLRSGAACPHIKAGPSKHHSITPSTYFGPGVVKTIQETCMAYEPAKLFVNAALSPVQQRNLELAVGVPVLDRVGLVIDIFAQRARTREARLQVMSLLSCATDVKPMLKYRQARKC